MCDRGWDHVIDKQNILSMKWASFEIIKSRKGSLPECALVVDITCVVLALSMINPCSEQENVHLKIYFSWTIGFRIKVDDTVFGLGRLLALSFMDFSRNLLLFFEKCFIIWHFCTIMGFVLKPFKNWINKSQKTFVSSKFQPGFLTFVTVSELKNMISTAQRVEVEFKWERFQQIRCVY